jgi:hypothetical protein
VGGPRWGRTKKGEWVGRSPKWEAMGVILVIWMIVRSHFFALPHVELRLGLFIDLGSKFEKSSLLITSPW